MKIISDDGDNQSKIVEAPAEEACHGANKEELSYDGQCFIIVDIDDSLEDQAENENNDSKSRNKYNTEEEERDRNEVEDGELVSDTEYEDDKHQSKENLDSRRYTKNTGQKRMSEEINIELNRNYDSRKKRKSPSKIDDDRHRSKKPRYSENSSDKYYKKTVSRSHEKDSSKHRYGCSSKKVSKSYIFKHSYERQHKPTTKDADSGSRFNPARKSTNHQHKESHHINEHSPSPVGKRYPNAPPILIENGKFLHINDNIRDKSPVRDMTSPVSDRSLSPYADFTRFRDFRTENAQVVASDQECGNGSLDNTVRFKEQPSVTSNYGHSARNVLPTTSNWIGQGFALPPLTTPNFDPRPVFNNTNQQCVQLPNFNQMPGIFMGPHSFASMGTPYQHYFYDQRVNIDGQSVYPNNQNAPMTMQRTLSQVRIENIECIKITSDTIGTMSEAIKSKIIPNMYKAMVASMKSDFTLDDIIEMMKQNRPIRIEFGTIVDLLTLLKVKDKFHVHERESKIHVSPKTDIRICQKFTNNPGNTHDCLDLHICKYYIFGACQRPRCKFEHNIKSSHNKMVLEKYSLFDQEEMAIKRLIGDLKSRNVTTVPLVCKFYNNAGGCQVDTCRHLHVCLYFINGECKFDPCMRSHSFEDEQPKCILREYGLHGYESDKQPLIDLLKAKMHNEVMKKKRGTLHSGHNASEINTGRQITGRPTSTFTDKAMGKYCYDVPKIRKHVRFFEHSTSDSTDDETCDESHPKKDHMNTLTSYTQEKISEFIPLVMTTKNNMTKETDTTCISEGNEENEIENDETNVLLRKAKQEEGGENSGKSGLPQWIPLGQSKITLEFRSLKTNTGNLESKEEQSDSEERVENFTSDEGTECNEMAVEEKYACANKDMTDEISKTDLDIDEVVTQIQDEDISVKAEKIIENVCKMDVDECVGSGNYVLFPDKLEIEAEQRHEEDSDMDTEHENEKNGQGTVDLVKLKVIDKNDDNFDQEHFSPNNNDECNSFEENIPGEMRCCDDTEQDHECIDYGPENADAEIIASDKIIIDETDKVNDSFKTLFESKTDANKKEDKEQESLKPSDESKDVKGDNGTTDTSIVSEKQAVHETLIGEDDVSYLPKTDTEYPSRVDDSEDITVDFTIKSMGKSVHIRRLDNDWQLQLTSISSGGKDGDIVTEEQVLSSVNAGDVDTEKVNNIIHMLKGLIQTHTRMKTIDV